MTEQQKEKLRLFSRLKMVRSFCQHHHHLFHKLEHVGTLVVVGGVISGIHELEVIASGWVAVVLVIMITAVDDVA